jgi:hypothetical protein
MLISSLDADERGWGRFTKGKLHATGNFSSTGATECAVCACAHALTKILRAAPPKSRTAAVSRLGTKFADRRGHDRGEPRAEWASVAEAARQFGRNVVAMPQAYGAETTLTRAATPFNAFTRLIAPAQRTGELSVRTGAQALGLEWSAAQRRVFAVVCRNRATGGA